jgi:hypothetical protein
MGKSEDKKDHGKLPPGPVAEEEHGCESVGPLPHDHEIYRQGAILIGRNHPLPSEILATRRMNFLIGRPLDAPGIPIVRKKD